MQLTVGYSMTLLMIKNIYIMRIENGEFVEDPDIVIVPEE